MKKPKGNLLTVAEVAARLGPSVPTIYRWCDRGLVHHYKYPGGSVFIPEAEVERIERESERKPVASRLPVFSRIEEKGEKTEEREKNSLGATA